MARIYLSAPHMGGQELGLVEEAFRTNWLSTVGPHLSSFEEELASYVGGHVVALASGTAGMHLALRLLGVGPGDEVFCPTLTFVATANPIRYLGAEPVLVDSDPATWNLDPGLLADALAERAARGRLPKAVIVVHLYGQTADMDPILGVCDRYEVPVLEDAAEALGADYKGRKAGGLAPLAVLSFNGNKIITTSGGGALVTNDPARADKVRFWSTQARDPGVAYEHSEVGYNYRLSNVLAGIGRGQLRVLDERVRQRRALAFRYRDELADLDGLSLMPQASYGLHTNWLSCFLVDEARLGCSRDALIEGLAAEDIEARPVWKPMHLQPLYARSPRYGGDVAASLFRRGICLPSGTAMTADDQARVVAVVRRTIEKARRP